MYRDAFVRLSPQECEQALTEINPALRGSDFSPSTVTILAQDISFYPGYRLIDIADYETTPVFRKFLVYKTGHAVALDWTNGPIYALNDRVGLGLVPDTVAGYVRFFFDFVRGPEGKFTIIESVDDIDWREEPPPAARKALGKMIKPLTVLGKDKAADFHIKACMTFQDSLYQAGVFVSPRGRVRIADEEILVDDLPVLDSTIGQ